MSELANPLTPQEQFGSREVLDTAVAYGRIALRGAVLYGRELWTTWHDRTADAHEHNARFSHDLGATAEELANNGQARMSVRPYDLERPYPDDTGTQTSLLGGIFKSETTERLARLSSGGIRNRISALRMARKVRKSRENDWKIKRANRVFGPPAFDRETREEVDARKQLEAEQKGEVFDPEWDTDWHPMMSRVIIQPERKARSRGMRIGGRWRAIRNTERTGDLLNFPAEYDTAKNQVGRSHTNEQRELYRKRGRLRRSMTRKQNPRLTEARARFARWRADLLRTGDEDYGDLRADLASVPSPKELALELGRSIKRRIDERDDRSGRH